MRNGILMLSSAALAVSAFATPAQAQHGGWPPDQDPPEEVVDAGGKGQSIEMIDPDDAYYQDDEVEPLADPDDTRILNDEPVGPRPYRPGDTYRGDGQPVQGDYCRRSDGATGAIVGGAGGALIGRGIDTRGRRSTGTILGALAGALIGSAIERGQSCR